MTRWRVQAGYTYAWIWHEARTLEQGKGERREKKRNKTPLFGWEAVSQADMAALTSFFIGFNRRQLHRTLALP